MDCRWGNWKVGTCSQTCGIGGRRTISREIIVEAAFGGKECRGPAVLEESCMEWKVCPSNIRNLCSEPYYLNLQILLMY